MKYVLSIILLSLITISYAQDGPEIKTPHSFDTYLCDINGKSCYYSKKYTLLTNSVEIFASSGLTIDTISVLNLEDQHTVTEVFFYNEKICVITQKNESEIQKYFMNEFDKSFQLKTSYELYETPKTVKRSKEEFHFLRDSNLIGFVSISKDKSADKGYAFAFDLDTKNKKYYEFNLDDLFKYSCMDFIMNDRLQMNIIIGEISMATWAQRNPNLNSFATLISCSETIKKQVITVNVDSLSLKSFKFCKTNKDDFILGSLVFDPYKGGNICGYSVFNLKFGDELIEKPIIVLNEKLDNPTLWGKQEYNTFKNNRYEIGAANQSLRKIIKTNDNQFVYVSESLTYDSPATTSTSGSLAMGMNNTGVGNATRGPSIYNSQINTPNMSIYNIFGNIIISKIDFETKQVDWCDKTIDRYETANNYSFYNSFEPSFVLIKNDNIIKIAVNLSQQNFLTKENDLPSGCKFSKTLSLYKIDINSGKIHISTVSKNYKNLSDDDELFPNTLKNGFIWIKKGAGGFVKTTIQLINID